MTAILSNYLYIPVGQFTLRSIAELRSELTVVPRNFAAKKFNQRQPVIKLYEDRMPGYIGIPKAWGREHFPTLMVEDRRSNGSPIECPKRPDPNHPRVREPAKQAKFMAELLDAAGDAKNFIASASTGSGKTVCALNMIAELGRTALIVVHLDRLLDQWVKEIKDKLGLTDDEIGVVQGQKCDYKGKKIVVAMLQSLSMKEDYPSDLWNYFGTVVFDEVHKIGSEIFSRAVTKFNVRVSVGLSATVRRRDGADKVFLYHLGHVSVRSEAEALPMDVYVIPYTCRKEAPHDNAHKSEKLEYLTSDNYRNGMILDQILRMHRTGRQALVVGDNIDHLHHLRDRCVAYRIPEEDLGMFTGQLIVDGKRKKASSEHLDRVMKDSQILFATYQMITEGIDIPRLDAGIDVTPRADAEQLIGRTRRPMPGKKDPIWVTFEDKSVKSFVRALDSRIKDYRNTGCRVFTMKERGNV